MAMNIEIKNSNSLGIENSFGILTLTEQNGETKSFKNIDGLRDYLIDKSTSFNNPSVSVTSYVSDDESIDNIMDLLCIAINSCESKEMYKGDCVKIHISVEYCPENK